MNRIYSYKPPSDINHLNVKSNLHRLGHPPSPLSHHQYVPYTVPIQANNLIHTFDITVAVPRSHTARLSAICYHWQRTRHWKLLQHRLHLLLRHVQSTILGFSGDSQASTSGTSLDSEEEQGETIEGLDNTGAYLEMVTIVSPTTFSPDTTAISPPPTTADIAPVRQEYHLSDSDGIHGPRHQ